MKVRRPLSGSASTAVAPMHRRPAASPSAAAGFLCTEPHHDGRRVHRAARDRIDAAGCHCDLHDFLIGYDQLEDPLPDCRVETSTKSCTRQPISPFSHSPSCSCAAAAQLARLDRILSESKLPAGLSALLAALLIQMFVLERPFTVIIDTFLLPVLIVLVMWRLSPAQKRPLIRAFHLTILLNVVIGYYRVFLRPPADPADARRRAR